MINKFLQLLSHFYSGTELELEADLRKRKKKAYLFPVCLDEAEDEAPVHDRQQVIKEEGQTCVKSLH